MGVCMQVAVIKSAGTDEQKVWMSSIENVGDDLQAEQLSPCIVVVGKVTMFGLLTAQLQ